MVKRKTPQKKRRSRLVQFIEYGISGGVYFWTGYAAFFVFYSVFHWSLWWAKILADVVGWVVNYMLQRFWVFSNSSLGEHRVQVTFRYAVITLADFILDYIIVLSLKTVGVSPYIGQFVSAGFFTVWNYIWYRWWVFPETHKLKHLKNKPAMDVAVSAAQVAQHVPRRGKNRKTRR
ncbi:MAG TPA: GtrA family protein [Candidatus Saccharimonadales bacterium]|nr:GtrA family protein [Candidatus Saccharimonadales bacterium]